mmetsp:Transcript_1889/g.4119  ORF Transcript_1889/g.4119 Transcript_1889/m.4119 type:complete len:242 (-) Transcript_1889:970-1695(-)
MPTAKSPLTKDQKAEIIPISKATIYKKNGGSMPPPKSAAMISSSGFQKSPVSCSTQSASVNKVIFSGASESNETVIIAHARAPPTTPERFKIAMTPDDIKRQIRRTEKADALRRAREWAKERYCIEPKSRKPRSNSPLPVPSILSVDDATATFPAVSSRGIQVHFNIVDVSYDSVAGLTYQTKKMYEVLDNLMHDDVIDGKVAVQPDILRHLSAYAEGMLRRTMVLVRAAGIGEDDSMECD